MIRYALKCGQGHSFDSWFQSASAFDALVKAGHVACAYCDSKDVSKALMAPRVAANPHSAEGAHRPEAHEQTPPVSPAQSTEDRDVAVAQMRKQVEENATYVGGKFAETARAMHDGTSPHKSIYGEASLPEARALLSEGVPVMPLPFKPKQKLQ